MDDPIVQAQCTKMDLNPGNRLIVRTKERLPHASVAALLRTVRKWAGEGVEVIYIPPGWDVTLEVDRGGAGR